MKIDRIHIKNQTRRSAGFTLIEVLMCIAIFSILFGTI
jgi:prepilin-type N-terminal cleavage/methylation domain-containing protein